VAYFKNKPTLLELVWRDREQPQKSEPEPETWPALAVSSGRLEQRRLNPTDEVSSSRLGCPRLRTSPDAM
jgi:hypothetical protein